jgi:hypothetical protein
VTAAGLRSPPAELAIENVETRLGRKSGKDANAPAPLPNAAE